MRFIKIYRLSSSWNAYSMFTMNLCLSVAKNSRSFRIESMLRLVIILIQGRNTWLLTFPSSRKCDRLPGVTLSKLCRSRPSPPCSDICKPFCLKKVAILPTATAGRDGAALLFRDWSVRSRLALWSHISVGISVLWMKFCWDRLRDSLAGEWLRRRNVVALNCRTPETVKDVVL
jgi:hypothetical protein